MNEKIQTLRNLLNQYESEGIQFETQTENFNYRNRYCTVEKIIIATKQGRKAKIAEGVENGLLIEYNNAIIEAEKARIDTLIEQEQEQVDVLIAEAEAKQSAAEQEKNELEQQLEEMRLSLNNVNTQAKQTTDEIAAIERANQAAIAEAIAQAEQAKADALEEQAKAFEDAKAAIEQAKVDAIAEQEELFEEAKVEEHKRRTMPIKKVAFAAGFLLTTSISILLYGLNVKNAFYFVGHTFNSFFVYAFGAVFTLIFLFTTFVGDKESNEWVRWIIPVELFLIFAIKPILGDTLPQLYVDGQGINWLAAAGLLVFSAAYIIQAKHAFEAAYRMWNAVKRNSQEQVQFMNDMLSSWQKK